MWFKKVQQQESELQSSNPLPMHHQLPANYIGDAWVRGCLTEVYPLVAELF